MKLKRITLENFRQFYGKQSIEFAETDQNVTVIFGENGKGKTGIFRALMFGLFGETHLSQDNKKDEIHLVNLLQLENNPGTPIKAEVSVEISHKGKNYLIERSIIGYKSGKIVDERIDDPKLFITDENGNFSINPLTGQDEIRFIINSIIDSKIKDFFLFDAEKIEMLSKTDANVKAEVKTGIVKLLQIDILDKGIEIIKNLYNAENRAIVEKSSNIDLKNKESEIEGIRSEIREIYEKIQIYENELRECRNEIGKYEEQLLANSEIRKIQEKIESIQINKNLKTQIIGSQVKALRELNFNQGHMIFAGDFYSKTKKYLEQSIREQKDLVPIAVIEKSLREMVCECCMTELKEGDIAYENIIRLKTNFERSEMTSFVSEIMGSIEEYSKEKDNILKRIKSGLKDIRTTKDDLDEIERDIDRYKNEIKDYSSSTIDLRKMEIMLEKCHVDQKKIEDRIRKMNIELESKEKLQEKTEREYEYLLEMDSSLKYDSKKLDYIKKIKFEFERIFSEYSFDPEKASNQCVYRIHQTF